MKIIKNPQKGIIYINTFLGSIQVRECKEVKTGRKTVIVKLKAYNDTQIEGIGTSIILLKEKEN